MLCVNLNNEQLAEQNHNSSDANFTCSCQGASAAGQLYASNSMAALLSVESSSIRIVNHLSKSKLAVLVNSPQLKSGSALLSFDTLLPIIGPKPVRSMQVSALLPQTELSQKQLKTFRSSPSLHVVGDFCEGVSSLPQEAWPKALELMIDVERDLIWGSLKMHDESARSCTGNVVSFQPLPDCQCQRRSLNRKCYWLSFNISYTIDNVDASKQIVTLFVPESSSIVSTAHSIVIGIQGRLRVVLPSADDGVGNGGAPQLVAGDSVILEYCYCNQPRDWSRFVVM